MAEVSREVLRRLYLAKNLTEIRQAFEYRQRIKTRWNTIKPKSVVEEIKEIDTKTDDWSVGIINKIYRDMFNNYFSENINKKSYKTFAKEWHKNIKLLCNYSNSKGILDT